LPTLSKVLKSQGTRLNFPRRHDLNVREQDDALLVVFEHVRKRYARRPVRGNMRDVLPSFTRRVRRPPVGSGQDENQFWAVDDVSFAVRKGEALGIVGRNGAGKSTILKLLAGVSGPTSGSVTVRGRFVALIELGAGFHPDLSGRENVYLTGSILGLKRAEIDRKMPDILAFAGIETFIDMPLKRYSSGMQARLGFAVAAHVEPEVLLIDEVLSVGDGAFQQKCMERMHYFRESGTAIVFVSHNLDAIKELCSKAILIDAGRVVAEGSPHDVVDAYNRPRSVPSSRPDAFERSDAPLTLEIVDGVVRDRQGRVQSTYGQGEVAMVEVQMRVHASIQDLVVGLSVRTMEGAVVYETNTWEQGCAPERIEPGKRLSAIFGLTLNLCRGNYTISVGVASHGSPAMLQQHENLCALSIVGDEANRGIANLRATVDIAATCADDDGIRALAEAL